MSAGAIDALPLAGIAAAIVAGVPGLAAVGTARDFGAARPETIAFPSAWVIPLAERAGPNRLMGVTVIDQLVEARFAVVLAVRDIADRAGAQALGGIEAIRPAVIGALGRFVPAGAYTTCRHVSGRLVSGIDRDGSMFWQDEFEVEFHRRIVV